MSIRHYLFQESHMLRIIILSTLVFKSFISDQYTGFQAGNGGSNPSGDAKNLGKENKIKTIVVILFLLTASTASTAHAEWTNTDTALQVAYTALATADWLQTRSISKGYERYHDGGCSKYTETNPIMGKNPDTWAVDVYFAGTTLAHAAVSYILPKEYRHAWQSVFIGIEGTMVVRNYSAGLKMDF